MTVAKQRLFMASCPSCGAQEGQIHYSTCGDKPLQDVKQSGGSITIALPPEVMPYQHDLRRFVDAMVFKLKVHHKKGRWEGKTIGEYVPLLEGEVAELKEAIDGGNLMEIFLEGADVANMALIAVSIATERGK